MDGGKRAVDPALDPFDEKNGYNPKGPSQYSKAFTDRYFAAQAKRMNELIDRALAIQARIGKGDYPYPDDDILLIPSGGNPGAGAGGDAKLATLDPSIADLQSTARPEKLPQKRRQHRHANRAQCRGRGAWNGQDQSRVRHGNENLHVEIVPERQCHARHERERGHRLLFEQQLHDLRGAVDLGPDHDRGDGRLPVHPR
jgi:hypothetical protein